MWMFIFIIFKTKLSVSVCVYLRGTHVDTHIHRHTQSAHPPDHPPNACSAGTGLTLKLRAKNLVQVSHVGGRVVTARASPLPPRVRVRRRLESEEGVEPWHADWDPAVSRLLAPAPWCGQS